MVLNHRAESAASGGPAISLLVDEIAERLKAGGGVNWSAVYRDHPEFASELRALRPAIEAIGQLSESAGRSVPRPEFDDEPAAGVLGDFRILREVGRGGMGVVYEAEQVSLGRRVALKVLPYAGALDERQLQRFRNEAKAAASLKHDHIVQVHAIGCDRGVHFYAMEFVDGPTLADAIAARRRPASSGSNRPHTPCGPAGAAGVAGAPGDATGDYIPAAPTAPVAALSTEKPRGDRTYCRRVAELIAQAADALEHAHSLGIVHRDVKPANLLLGPSGKLYVSDFGLARFGPDAGLTASGDLLGTLRYMAPEQALARHGLVDHRADVYGLGATLYELLTGRPAVDGTDRAEVLRAIAFEEPVPPRKLDKAIPAELETVTLKALAKNPAERYATAGELADDLRRWLGDQTIKAKPPTLGQRAAKWARRHKYLARSAVAVLAVTASALAVSTAVVFREKRQTEAAYGQVKNALQRADSQRRLARKAVDQLSSVLVYDWIVRQAKLTPEKTKFLGQTADLYRQFAEEARDTEEARADVADAHLRFGTLQRYLGQAAEAEAALTRAREGFDQLTADFPDRPDYRVHLASTLVELGDCFADQARKGEGIQLLTRAVDLLERVVAADPSNPSRRFRLAEVYGRLARLSPRDGQEPISRKAVGILEELIQKDSQPDYRKELAVNNVVLARCMYFGGRVADARVYCRRGIDLFERLAADRRDPNLEADAAWSYATLGVIATWERRLEEAEEFLAASLSLRESLAARFPGGITGHRQSVPMTLLLRGQVQVRLDRPAAAEQTFRRMVDAMDRLAADGPLSKNMRDHHSASHNRLGSVLAATGRLAEAESSCRRGLDLADKLDADVPGVGGFMDEHATGHTGLGTVLYYTGRQEEAADHFRRAVPLRERLITGIGRKDFEARHHRRLADLLSNCPEATVRDSTRAVAVARQAVEVEPADGDNHQSLGMALYRDGHCRAAAEALTKAIEHRPGRAVDRLFLAMARSRLGEPVEARRLYDQAVEWTAEHWPDDPDLRRLKTEAAGVLGVKEPKAPDKPAPKP